MVLLWILLLALAQQATGAIGSDLQIENDYYATDIGATIAGRYVVILKSKDLDVAAAAERLASDVQRATAALPRRAAAALATARIDTDSRGKSHGSSPMFTVLSTLKSSAVTASISSAEPHAATAASDATQASLPSKATGIQGMVVEATPDVIEFIKHCKEVAAVFADRVIGGQVAAPRCVEAHTLSKGTITSQSVSASFKWPGCLTPDTRLVWVGQRCRDMSLIQYVAVHAVDKSTGVVKVHRGKECVLRPDTKQPGWSAQRFGSCGKAPIYASDLPTTVCAGTGSSGSSSCLKPVDADAAAPAASVVSAAVALTEPAMCDGKPARRLTYAGRGCGPNNAFIQWVQATTPDGCIITNPNPAPRSFSRLSTDVFGSCGVPPGKAAEDLPGMLCATPPKPPRGSPPRQRSPAPQPRPVAPEPDSSPVLESSSPPSPSPQPQAVAYSGPRLPRVPVSEGEAVPAGVTRIGAAVEAGVANTAGLPTEQQVVVAVIDSGVDATHPDLNYAGGQTWIKEASSTGVDDRAPDIDVYGHGTHVAGIIGAKNNGLGVVGVSPGTPIYSLKVLDGSGRGSLANLLAAVKWVTTEGVHQGVKVINLSLAAYVDPASEDFQAVYDTICGVLKEASDAGVFIAAAAGNYVASLQGYFPATCHAVAAVTAIDQNSNTPAAFSNYLPLGDSTTQEQAHVIAAPGVAIRSTISYSRDPSGYRELSGTSQAAPHVAGIAANCIMARACTGSTGAHHLAALQSAAQLRANVPGGPNSGWYGFSGDVSSTTDNGRFYGNLAWSAY